MTCKVDRAIDLFDPGSPGKRPKRRCRICHDASAERPARPPVQPLPDRQGVPA
jgi:hypothetical protein